MYYVERWHKFHANNKQLHHKSAVVVVFIFLIFITILVSSLAYQTSVSGQSKALEQSLNSTEIAIRTRLAYYDVMLAGISGFLTSNPNPTSEQWGSYANELQISTKNPEIKAVGYMSRQTYPAATEYSNRLRTDRNLPLGVQQPPNDGQMGMVISYIYPEEGINRQAIGYDAYSEKNRKDAIDMSINSDTTVVSHPITTIIKNAPRDTVSLLLFHPTWSGVPAPGQQEQIRGMPFIGFEASKVFADMGNDNSGFAFRLDDTYNGTLTEIYQTPRYAGLIGSRVAMQHERYIDVFGQQWKLSGVATPSILSKTERYRPIAILIMGTMLSFLGAVFVYLLLQHRIAIVGQREEKALVEAKNELLALASHQLRTPATGVKQYLGIVLQGYAGSVPKEQSKYLKKAYESNERQLNTINEMLFVAKSDAGNVEIRRAKINVVSLVKDIVSEQKTDINSRHQTINTYYPTKNITINADSQYLRMALENVLSNATKYTHENGTINVKLHRRGRNLIISVADTGVGISKNDQNLLFKKFSRIPNELTSRVNGSGIGLYLAKQIIEAHKGTIELISEPGIGTECVIKLPL